MEEIDIEAKLLEIELRQQRENREENANLSPCHDPTRP